MSPELVILDRPAEGVARLRFNRPETLNALDVPLAHAFRDAVNSVTSNDKVRAILLCGTGRAFVAGGDVAAFGSDPENSAEVVANLLDALNPAILSLRDGNAPVVAAVRGVAAGAGLSIAMMADLIIADDRARFVMAYDKVGAAPDCGGTWFLPRRVGRARAMEMMLLGDSIDAGKALETGLVNELAPSEAVEDRALEIAVRLASGPTRAYGAFRRLVDAAEDNRLDVQLEAEKLAFIAATSTGDFREGTAAFIDKRKPSFTGA